jgi:FkbH-like protein
LKSYHIFRNYTVEYLFENPKNSFSAYGDINSTPKSENYIWFYQLPIQADPEGIIDEIKSFKQALKLVVDKINPSSNLVLFSMFPIFGIDYISKDKSVSGAITGYNNTLYELAESRKNVKFLSINSFFSSIGNNDYIDWKYYYSSFILINPKYTKLFKVWFEKQLASIQLIRKKCIVLDLDNTLWGGILGEDGENGIELGNTYPGNAYRAFQQNLLQLTRYGVILAICSKNNEADVLDLWRINSEMVLKKDHFVSWRINWQNKADNIIEISNELNIGLDSIVFIDDNPSERELVTLAIPDVIAPEFPKSPYDLQHYFKLIVEQYFQTYELTDEDVSKHSQYMANKERENFRNDTGSFIDYLKALGINIQVYEAGEAEILRISQMTQKTNQFNLTTKRCSENEIRKYVNGDYRVFVLKVRDKFGDNGITGTCVVKILNSTASIEIFLLSCRILGKGIESIFLSAILNNLYKENILDISASYIRSNKNDQTESFYDQNGFQISKENSHGKRYKIHLEKTILYDNSTYEIRIGK